MKGFYVVAGLAEKQHGLCTRVQLVLLGATRHQIDYALKSGLLVREQAGVYGLAGTQRTPEPALLPACLASGAVASHRSAARVWGLPTPGPVRTEVLAVGRRAPRLRDTVVHRTDRRERADRTTRDAIPTTALARTVLDLGAVLRPWDVELAMEDAVLRLGTSIHALRDCLDRMAANGRRGAGVLRAILDWRDPDAAGPQGALNLAIVRLLRRHRFPPWVAEHWVTDKVRLDVAWPASKVGIEGDSRRWHAGRFDVQRNARKSNILTTLGWRVFHYTFVDVRYGPATLVTEVADGLATRCRAS